MKSEGFLQPPQDIMEEYNGCSVPQYTAYRRVDCMYRGYLKGYTTVTEVPYTSDYLEES